MLFTVGYEGRTVAQLVLRLREAAVTRVVDVRRSPRSPRPGFSRGSLAKAFAAAGIGYVHLGEVGNPFFAEAGDDLARVLERYRAHLAEHPELVDLVLGAATGDERAALLCAEANPRRCHRGVLAEALTARGERVVHL